MSKSPKIPLFNPNRVPLARPKLALPPKTVAPVYQTPEHRTWRDAVLKRAGSRCEARDDRGNRCTKAAPAHRMFADHIKELFDGGAKNDIQNGQCLCGSHHTAKTMQARAARRFGP